MPTLTEALQKSGHSNSAWLEIRLGRLLSNLNTLKRIAGLDTQIMAVVKANAYGHGLIETAKALSGRVAYLGVANLYEALELKEHGIETPIFLFGRLFGIELQTAIKSGLTLSVSSLEEAREISSLAEFSHQKARIHIKVDTGMGRLGIPEREAVPAVENIAGLPGLVLEGIYTHFPTAEREDGFMETQFRNFCRLVQTLETKGIYFHFKHAANSAACLKFRTFTQSLPLVSEAGGQVGEGFATPPLPSPLKDQGEGNCSEPLGLTNLIRPGLILYGIYPDPGLKQTAVFSPVLTLKSRIILVKHLNPGDSAGYGRSFVAKSPTTLAILPLGYSHGYPFHLSNRSWALYHGRRFPIAGRVSMDYLALDLENTPAQVGDEVTLLGEEEREAITAEDLAAWAGTIPYEIVTRLSSRLPRLFLHPNS